ncbi:MAG TPA: ParB/RepB/Spo0J family partition protein [Candidatus Bathyarchaeia archaeon]|nr:ParB/RepB/Spo0J family partition protein [Candidatus Bathyarchaeia archaeon]
MVKPLAEESIREIEISLIDSPEQSVRLEIADYEINELAESIREMGLLQPVLVHPKGVRFEVIAGDRRYLAHKKLGLNKIMCIVKDIPEEEIVWLRAVENIQRKNLTPLEEGSIYVALLNDKHFTIAEIAKKMGKSAGVIKRRMDILKMPDSFQRALHEGKINSGVAESLWSCPDAAKQEYFLELAIEHGITTEVARMWVDDFKKSLRGIIAEVEGGSSDYTPYQEQPIYRACDICKGPVNYKEIVDFRVCSECGKGIRIITNQND